MKSKLLCLIGLFFALSPFRAYASERFFGLNAPIPLLNFENIIKVNIDFSMKEDLIERFIVRPSVSSGLVFFTQEFTEDENLHSTFPSKDLSLNFVKRKSPILWSDFPKLSREFEINIDGNFESTKLWFEILDTKTGKIYKTNKKEIWSNLVFKNYLDKLNRNLSKW